MNRTRLIHASALTALLVVAAPAANADNLKITVTEIAGRTAYLDAGSAAGLVPGSIVMIGEAAYTVVDATAKTAAITIKGGEFKVGAIGQATVAPGAKAASVQKLAAPRPASTWHEQWPQTARPAQIQIQQQQVKAVPLGGAVSNGVFHLDVMTVALANLDPDGLGGLAESRIIATYDVMRSKPLAVDADLGIRVYGSGYDAEARIPVMLRTLQLRYGRMLDPYFALGRLRWASSSVGMLDGARAMVRRGNIEASAFGGLTPDALNGVPSTVARFGGEVAYDAPNASWQPRISVGFVGSNWEGAIDEKRLTAMASAGRNHVSLSGWSELQFFGSDNPWNANATELTGAGASVAWRSRGFHAAVDATLLKPERSRRLEFILGNNWTCARDPAADRNCVGGDYWLNATGSVGIQRNKFAVNAGGTITKSQGVADTATQNGYVRGEVTTSDRNTRVGVMLAGNRGSFVDWIDLEGSFTHMWSREFEIQLRYRPQVISYVADVATRLQHHVTADLRYAVNDKLDLGFEAGGRLGEDRNSAFLLTTIAWRPLP